MNSAIVKGIINSIDVVRYEGEWRVKIDYPDYPFEVTSEDCTNLENAFTQAGAEAKNLNAAMKGKSKPKT